MKDKTQEIHYLGLMLTAITIDDKQRLWVIESKLAEIRTDGVVGS